MTTATALPMATCAPSDRYAGKCPFVLVDPAPHHYRIQGSRWETQPYHFVRNVDCLADTAADAERLRAHFEAQGFKMISVLSPQCDGSEHYDLDGRLVELPAKKQGG